MGTVEMPYMVAQFDAAKQTSYKKAGTTPANIDLVITAARRASHGGGKINVATTIRAPSAKRLTEIKKTMSADDTTKLKNKLNTALAAQGLSASTSAAASSSTGSPASGSTTTPSPSLDAAAGRLENTYIAAVALAMLVSLSMSALT